MTMNALASPSSAFLPGPTSLPFGPDQEKPDLDMPDLDMPQGQFFCAQSRVEVKPSRLLQAFGKGIAYGRETST
jgi:hypothetical protein